MEDLRGVDRLDNDGLHFTPQATVKFAKHLKTKIINLLSPGRRVPFLERPRIMSIEDVPLEEDFVPEDEEESQGACGGAPKM